MSLKEEDRQILVQLELEKADNTLSQVAVLQREGYWDTMANRIYYSLFHAVSALLKKALSILRWKLCVKSRTIIVSSTLLKLILPQKLYQLRRL